MPLGIDSRNVINTLLVAFDLSGTFVFALSGATAAIRHKLDIFGVMVLCFVTATAGGITRDLMIGAVPPAAIRDWRYLSVCLLAGLLVFFWYPLISRMDSPVLFFDAAGLGLFCVAGAEKALAFNAGPVAATLLGMMTGIGGGIVRDVLVRQVPAVFQRTQLYAVAALAGAAVLVGGSSLGLSSSVAAPAGAIICFVIRLLAIRHNWVLPVAGEEESPKPD